MKKFLLSISIIAVAGMIVLFDSRLPILYKLFGFGLLTPMVILGLVIYMPIIQLLIIAIHRGVSALRSLIYIFIFYLCLGVLHLSMAHIRRDFLSDKRLDSYWSMPLDYQRRPRLFRLLIYILIWLAKFQPDYDITNQFTYTFY